MSRPHSTSLAWPALGVALVLASAAPAWEPPAAPDILARSLIGVDRPVEPKAAEWRYRVTARRPFPDLPSDARQTFTRTGETAGDLIVRRPTAPEPGMERLPVAAPKGFEACAAASGLIESDSDEIVALARRALAGETDSVKAAARLEAFVGEYITDKTLAVGGLVTAKQVAAGRKGDCRQHAVLLTALARASGLPARAVGGLAFCDEFAGRRNVFAYHLWTELYVSGRWRPYDAVFAGRGGVGAGHIALTTNDLSAFNADLQLGVGLMHAVGNLRLEPLEPARPEGKTPRE